MDHTAIIHTDGGTALLGDATTLYSWKVLQQSIGLYMRTGMIPTRGVTISRMLKFATAITKKPYKNTPLGRQQAYDDLGTSCATLRAAIPDVDARSKK